MQNLGKYIWIIGSLFFTLLHAANVKATVDSKEVIQGDSVSLRIQATGEDIRFPKITEIAGIPVVNAGTATSMNMSISINGTKRENTTTKQYTFVPKQSMTIPSFSVTIGKEVFQTNPIYVNVLKRSATTVKTNTRYSFEMKSTKKNLVVGESFIVTLYLSISDNLGAQQVSEYIEPSSPEFFFKDIGKQKQYKKGHFQVIEKQYSVTAKKEGTFSISPASVKIGVEDRRRRDMFGRYGIRWIGINSNTLDITVATVTSDSDLVGEFALQAKVDKKKVKVNKPVNMTITIRGKGNLEDFELPKYEIDGVTVYEDEAKVQSHIENGVLISFYRKKLVFIAEENFTIPKKEISIYNTQTEKIESLSIPAYPIEIDTKHVAIPKAVNTLAPKTIPATKEVSHTQPKEETVLPSWWMLFGAFVLGMFVMYVGRYIPKLWKGHRSVYKNAEALKILYAHISEDKAVEEMVRKLYAKQNGDTSVQIDKKVLREMVERFR